jgi:hypothetical protein
MQLTEQTVEKYRQEAPELLQDVVGDTQNFVMRRDEQTNRCVRFSDGLCGIHRDYGEAFLGDACRFYPRITRALGSMVITSAALSCPEAARLMLTQPDSFALTAREEIEVPFSLKNYLPDGIEETQALAIHAQFMDEAGREDITPDQALMRISTVARALQRLPVASWPDAVPMYFEMADGRIPAPEAHPNDVFNLLHATYGLMSASQTNAGRLRAIIDALAEAMGMQFQADGSVRLEADATARCLKVIAHMRQQANEIQSLVRRYLQAQLSQALLPFSGAGATLEERVTMIGVRFATVRLLLASLPLGAANETMIALIQSYSRMADHLADATLAIQIYNETGWIREPRLRALLSH